MNVRVGVVCLFILGSCAAASGQTAPPRDAQAVLLLQQSLSALSGGVAIQDVTLTGTVQRTAGSTSESGAATLKGTASGDSLIEFDLPSGTLTESRDITAQPPTGAWEGSGGAAQAIPPQNLATDPTWFYPALLIERALTTASYGVVYAGATTEDGASVYDVRINSYPLGPPSGKGVAGTLARTLGQLDLYLDAKTGLPVALKFNSHPDNNALADLPVNIRYLHYAKEGAALVPSEIQRYLNGSLVLDVRPTSAQFNTGLSPANLSLQ